MGDGTPLRDDDGQLQLRLLVVRCQAGDELAFARLLETFGPRTLRYLRGILDDDADDVQQEVWLSVYRSIATLADPGAFRTWLFSTTRRRAIDHRRRLTRDHAIFDEIAIDVAAGPDAFEPAFTDAELDAVLAALPDSQREVVLLRYRDDMTYSEIAVIVGCPVGTVRTRLHHAKRKLRELLQRRAS
ncbi:MAG TPA: RNA polymerase sigma factor [Gemmatimonadales bacterium]|jgi:RNA polymerase sigma-70 factor (ECF subfamily)